MTLSDDKECIKSSVNLSSAQQFRSPVTIITTSKVINKKNVHLQQPKRAAEAKQYRTEISTVLPSWRLAAHRLTGSSGCVGSHPRSGQQGLWVADGADVAIWVAFLDECDAWKSVARCSAASGLPSPRGHVVQERVETSKNFERVEVVSRRRRTLPRAVRGSCSILFGQPSGPAPVVGLFECSRQCPASAGKVQAAEVGASKGGGGDGAASAGGS